MTDEPNALDKAIERAERAEARVATAYSAMRTEYKDLVQERDALKELLREARPMLIEWIDPTEDIADDVIDLIARIDAVLNPPSFPE